MDDYLIKEETLTAMGNNVRSHLNNEEPRYSPEEMTTALDGSIDYQSDLIAQIQAVVDSLPEANSGEGGIELPELTNPGAADDVLESKELIDGEGNIVTGTIETKTSGDAIQGDSTLTLPTGYYAEDVVIDTSVYYDEGHEVGFQNGYQNGYEEGFIAGGGGSGNSEVEKMMLVSDENYTDDGYMFYSPYKHLEIQRTALSSRPTITTILNKQSDFYLHIYMQITVEEQIDEDEYGSPIFDYIDYNHSYVIEQDGDLSLDFSDEAGTVVDTNIIGIRWSTDGI